MSELLAAAAAALAVLTVFDAVAAVGASRALRLTERVLAPARRAGRTGAPPDRGERRRLAATAAITCCAAGWLAAGVAGALVAALAGPPGAAWFVAARRRRWRRAVAAQTPDAARALAAASTGGRSLPAAIAVAARDGAVDREAGDLLGGVAGAIALGAAPADALRAAARAAGPGPWPALVAALLVQREAGGDIARLLTTFADGLDVSARAAADARSASAQARLTARIVVALPAVAAVLAGLAAPGALARVLEDPLAVTLVAAATALQVGALVAVRRIARVGEA